MSSAEEIRGIADQIDGMLHTGKAVTLLRAYADLLETGSNDGGAINTSRMATRLDVWGRT